MKKSKRKPNRKAVRSMEIEEIELLNSWIDSQKPGSGTNPLSFPPLGKKEPIGRIGEDSFSKYVGSTRFDQLPISKKTKRGLKDAGFVKMTDIQRASLPHSLCGRDILGAAKTGIWCSAELVLSTESAVKIWLRPMLDKSYPLIQYSAERRILFSVLEKLYKERWGPEDGVGSIIISPTRELADQLFDVLKAVGKHHNFSAGLLIGGRRDVDMEKERVNELNILVCTPGRLLQHMDETPNFDCSQLQSLILDEADRILDVGFKKALNAIVSQLPKHRQTFLFSATQTKSVQDLARLSLKDPEYLSVHEESVTATPNRLQQTAMIVPLEHKLDMLWSFIKAHLNSKILVFLTSCKQVKYVFEAFKKLRPGIPLMCLYGRMKQDRRMAIYAQFCEKRSVLFCTDVASRGLDFNKAVDWVVQVDCPQDVASYIHRVGRTARYNSGGRSVLFLTPTEMKMLEKLQEAKIPIHFTKANTKRLQPVSGLLAALLVKYPDMQHRAQKAFITYLRSVHIQKDKEVFDVTKLSIDEFSASLGLPMTPKIRLLNQKGGKMVPVKPVLDNAEKEDKPMISREKLLPDNFTEENVDRDILETKDIEDEGKADLLEDVMRATRVKKNKKLKINVHRPLGTRLVFDEECNTVPPLAMLADTKNANVSLDQDQKTEYYKKIREELKRADKEDKLLDRQRRREKRIKQKMKRKRGGLGDDGDEEDEDNASDKDEESMERGRRKKSKIYFDNDTDSDNDNDERKQNKDDNGPNIDSISLAEQEALALKLLNSMHS